MKYLNSPLKLGAIVALALALLAQAARADTAPPFIRVTGEGSVTSRPDRVEIDLGVVTRAPTSQQATAENARISQNVLAALRNALGPKADIQTTSFALQPDYQFPPQGRPTISGYTATNIVRVTHDDLSGIGAVIDAATRAGANQIERIRFTLKNESAAKANALRLATLDARAKAESLANAANLQIVRIRSVEESSPTPRPLYDLAFRAAPESTPILPGALETTAMVTLTVDVAPRR